MGEHFQVSGTVQAHSLAISAPYESVNNSKRIWLVVYFFFTYCCFSSYNEEFT